jgi:hypothetical protein
MTNVITYGARIVRSSLPTPPRHRAFEFVRSKALALGAVEFANARRHWGDRRPVHGASAGGRLRHA